MRAHRHTPEHKPRTATYVIPRLRERMAAKQASAQSLADRAGVSRELVSYARQGFPITPFLGECVESALEKFDFGYLKCGRRKTS